MSDQSPGKLTKADRNAARVLKVAPAGVWALSTFPVGLFFLFLYFAASVDNAIYLLAAFTSFGVGAVLGLVLALLVVLYRRRWHSRLRERLAADGITADELPYFQNELKTSERAALRSIEQGNPALAEAYRETLAARLTATRLLTRTKRELVRVGGRVARAKQITSPEARELERDLEADRSQLTSLRDQAELHLSQALARLQTIEAVATRGKLQGETDVALQRLKSATEQSPLALESARLEIEARQQLNELTAAHMTEIGDKSAQ